MYTAAAYFEYLLPKSPPKFFFTLSNTYGLGLTDEITNADHERLEFSAK